MKINKKVCRYFLYFLIFWIFLAVIILLVYQLNFVSTKLDKPIVRVVEKEIENKDSISMLISCKLVTCRDDMDNLMSRRIDAYSNSKSMKERTRIDKELDDLDKLLDFPDDKRVTIQWFLPTDSSKVGGIKDFNVDRLMVRDTDGKILVDVNF